MWLYCCTSQCKFFFLWYGIIGSIWMPSNRTTPDRDVTEVLDVRHCHHSYRIPIYKQYDTCDRTLGLEKTCIHVNKRDTKFQCKRTRCDRPHSYEKGTCRMHESFKMWLLYLNWALISKPVTPLRFQSLANTFFIWVEFVVIMTGYHLNRGIDKVWAHSKNYLAREHNLENTHNPSMHLLATSLSRLPVQKC